MFQNAPFANAPFANVVLQMVVTVASGQNLNNMYLTFLHNQSIKSIETTGCTVCNCIQSPPSQAKLELEYTDDAKGDLESFLSVL